MFKLVIVIHRIVSMHPKIGRFFDGNLDGEIRIHPLITAEVRAKV